jgi:3-hydroxyacyl-CoA dehydrogenase
LSEPVQTSIVDGVLAIIANSPPVSAFGVGIWAGLEVAIQPLADDPDVKAGVIDCDRRTFFAGADITEFGTPPLAPGPGDAVATKLHLLAETGGRF